MSAIAVAYAMGQAVGDGHAKHVLIHLANRHHPDTGRCFPSIERIAAEAEISVATVQRKLEHLERKGLIEVIERPADPDTGRRRPNGYLLTFVPPPAEIDAAPSARTRGLPPRDWQPQPETIAKLQEEFPEHDVEEAAASLVADWIDYAYANGRLYARFDEGFRNSARMQLRRRPAGRRGGGSARDGALGAAERLIRRRDG